MFGFKKAKPEAVNPFDPKVSAYDGRDKPVNDQLREARIGLINVRNYFVGRMNKGDPLFDQWMVDALEASQEGLKNLDKLEDALGVPESTREEINTLLIKRMNFKFGDSDLEPSENQDY